MASYLGKISAVVVANTANFSRNLNTAAGDLRKFAGTVQRDITKASTDANRAFGSMLTPLQRLERSLQAASSMKLSFRGFSGAIRTVDELQQRLTKLNQKQIDLVVKTSGFRTITQFRQAIEGIDQQTFDFALRFGGLDGLREIRNQVESLSRDTVGATLFAGRQSGVTNVLERLKALRETVDSLSGQPRQLALQVGGETQLKRAEQAAIGLSRRDLSLFLKVGGRENLDRVIEEIQSVDKTTIDALVKVRGVPELDAAIERFSAASPEQINAVIKVLGEQDLVSATERMRALASAGRQVFEPLASVANGLPSLGLRVEQAFLPGFSAVQSSADRLKEQIDGIGTGANTSRLTTEFDKAAAAAERAVQSFNRLKQASTAVAAFDDGTSFRFVQPEATATIERALRLQQQSLNLTPSQQRTGNFAFRSQQIAGELRSLEELNARRESIVTAGPGFGVRGVESYRQALAAADSAILQQSQKVSGLLDIWERVTNQVTAAERAQQASSQLNVLSPSDLQLEAQRASSQLNVLSPSDLRGDLERAASQQIGADIPLATRQLDQLDQRVQGVRAQIVSLPATVGSQFIPQLQRAEQEFIRLRASGRATAEEIENAGNNVDQLAAQVRRVGAAQGLGSFADGLDDTALRGAIGSLQALQQILNRVGATAGSDAARQFDRMRAAIQQATRNGTIGSEAFQRELRQISQEAANAAAATGKIGKSAAFREIQRGGDIARGGFDKFSLAAQQAAFAIDDFFSATGDFTQKIRAVQNNVTQLAFILGGTTGLFIGLGVAIAAQAAVALFKFFNETEKASFGAEYLNDALQKQKSLAEETAQAFSELGDSVAAAGSEFGSNRDAFQINEELRQRSERRQQQAEQFVLQTNPRVIQAEAEVRRLEKELEEADDRVTRARVSGQLSRARRDLRITRNQVTSGAASGPGFDGASVQRTLEGARDVERQAIDQSLNQFDALTRLFTDFFATAESRQQARANELDTTSAQLPATAEAGVELITKQIDSLQQAYEDLGYFDRLFNTENASRIRDEIERLDEERGRLQFQAATKVNELLDGLDRTSLVARREIETTLQGLSNIGTDIDVTGPLADQIAEQAEQLRQAQQTAQRGTEIGGDAGRELVEEARKQAEEAQKALRETYAQIDALARDVALGAEVSIGQRLGAALDEVGNLGPSIVETSLRRAQAELDQLNRERARAKISGDTDRVAELDAERDALRQQTAGLEESAIALQTFQSAVEEAALALVDTLVSEAKRAADQARRNANQAVGEGRFDAADAQAQSAQARQRQRELEQQRLELDNQVAQARLDFEENNPVGRDLARRIREGRQRANDATLTAQQREAARADAAIAQAELDDRVRNLPAVRAARAEADRQDQQRFREQAEARRGRERASGRATALDREFDSFRRIASDLGDIEQLRSLQELERNIADVREAISAAAEAQVDAGDSVKAELDRLEREAERTRSRLIEDSIRAEQDVLGGFEAQTRAAERELSQSGVGIAAVQGDLVRARQRRQSLVAQLDAITGEDDASQNRRERLQQEIDAIDEWSAELNASAIAVAGFQDALNEAALSLQNTVTAERERAAEQSRRQANEAEAVFGADSPFAKEARDREARDRQAASDAQARRREAEREVGRQRAEFERELAANPNSEAALRAERIREQEQIAADQARSTAERERAAAEARRLRAEQQAEFEQRPGVQAARQQADEADVALQQRRSADRAFERSRTERQRQEREAAQIAGDLRNRFELDNVNPLQQQQEVNQTVRSEAERLAPLLVNFAEQRQNAVLQGPSRAALQVQDITTTQGRNELNRLLRGDDSARDVNLVELKKQTSALQQVITAIEKATGVVATVDS